MNLPSSPYGELNIFFDLCITHSPAGHREHIESTVIDSISHTNNIHMKIIYYMNIILYATRNGLNTISNRKKETDVESVSFGKITDNLLFRIKRRSCA